MARGAKRKSSAAATKNNTVALEMVAALEFCSALVRTGDAGPRGRSPCDGFGEPGFGRRALRYKYFVGCRAMPERQGSGARASPYRAGDSVHDRWAWGVHDRARRQDLSRARRFCHQSALALA